ncbi:hypothetical protein HPB47_005538 [Ixodes persulcatus]|uniref:Uncharacterized protein n=1 Tax=Ixodes persulcatus TaxID=34615 RepID=A0AC60PDN3_IXOPE|nr:hypothetical protein HPB47_005538 [Ixodes persulcatus]
MWTLPSSLSELARFAVILVSLFVSYVRGGEYSVIMVEADENIHQFCMVYFSEFKELPESPDQMTSFLDYGKPRQSPTPQLKIQLPGRAITAGGSADPPSQSTNTRSPAGKQPQPSHTEGRRVDTLAHTPWIEHHPRSGMALVSLLQRPRGRNGTQATGGMMQYLLTLIFVLVLFWATVLVVYGIFFWGTCESRCLESGVSTDPEPCGFARPRLAVRGFRVSGEKGILVVEPNPGGPAPRSESRATQVSPEILPADFRAPVPRQGQQLLPPVPGGSKRAAPPSRDRPAAAAPAPSSRSPGETERASRSCSLERAPLLKEQHGAHAAPVKGGDQTSLDDPSPSSPATLPAGRARAVSEKSRDCSCLALSPIALDPGTKIFCSVPENLATNLPVYMPPDTCTHFVVILKAPFTGKMALVVYVLSRFIVMRNFKARRYDYVVLYDTGDGIYEVRKLMQVFRANRPRMVASFAYDANILSTLSDKVNALRNQTLFQGTLSGVELRNVPLNLTNYNNVLSALKDVKRKVQGIMEVFVAFKPHPTSAPSLPSSYTGFRDLSE